VEVDLNKRKESWKNIYNHKTRIFIFSLLILLNDIWGISYKWLKLKECGYV